MLTSELFDKVGGRVEAAKMCGVTLWATYKWDEEGIPSKHWSTFSDAADLSFEEVAKVQPIKPRAEGISPSKSAGAA